MGFETDNAVVHMASLLRRSLANRANELQRGVASNHLDLFLLSIITKRVAVEYPTFVSSMMKISLGQDSISYR
jgi:hypothetical protein